MQERKRVRGGRDAGEIHVGGNYVTMLDILQLKTGYREEANKKRVRGTRGGRFGLPFPPYKCNCKNTSNWIQSKIS